MPYLSFSILIHSLNILYYHPLHISEACISALGQALQSEGGNVEDEARSRQGKKKQRKRNEGLKLEDQEISNLCYLIFGLRACNH